MPSRSLNRVLWILALLAIAVFGFKAQQTLDAYFVGVGSLRVRDVPSERTVYLSWRGRIDAPMEARLREAFDKYGSSSDTFVLDLSSPGGSIDQGARVIRLLREIRRSHRLDTRVDAGRQCASMCVPVYLQGERRTAAADTRFMFHEVSFREELSDDEVSVPQTAKSSATDRLFARYFAPAGVSQDWIAKVRAQMAGGNDIWLTARELVRQDAGIVQDIF
ncbi:MAG TPA: ATP-dependent Clp protease proteolytic subunit [Hyphomicrobium sp.]|nr:ATP-dependent Clp protease proteolytic subunit [Hyphomicrobium sp.]